MTRELPPQLGRPRLSGHTWPYLGDVCHDVVKQLVKCMGSPRTMAPLENAQMLYTSTPTARSMNITSHFKPTRIINASVNNNERHHTHLAMDPTPLSALEVWSVTNRCKH